MEIRVFREDDLRAIALLRAETWQTEAFWFDRVGRYLAGEHSSQHALLPRAIFVAMDGAELAGFVAGHRTRRFGCQGELQWIDVAPNHRRQGIAGRLLHAMAGWFVSNDALLVCVNVAAENLAARGLYMKFGARPLSEGWLVWDDIRAVGSGGES